MTLFWSGCYSGDLDGRGKGIGVLRRQVDGTLRYLGTAATADSPSYLVQHPTHPNVIYALLEGSARIEAWKRSGELGFNSLGSQEASGILPCHASVMPNGAMLFSASYGNGTLAATPLAADGSLQPLRAVLSFVGSGPHPDQSHARGHSAAVVSADTLVNLDLGSDEVRLFRIAADGSLQHLVTTRLPAGSGPRDVLVHQSGYLMVLAELSNEVFVVGFSSSAAELRVVSSVSLAGPEGALGTSQAAGLSSSADGRFIYAATRGADLIVTFAVSDGGRQLTRVGAVASGGEVPRHHLVHADNLYVCNQESDNISSFRLDERSGIPEPIGAAEPVPSPTFLLRAEIFA